MKSGWTEAFRGETVTLNCEIEGGGGEEEWIYSWYKDETEISTIKQSEYTFEVNNMATFTCMGSRTVGDPQSTEKSNSVTLPVSGEFLHLYVFPEH